MEKQWEELEKRDTYMAKREALRIAVVLSMKKEKKSVILKRDVDNQAFFKSKNNAMKYII